MSVEMQVDIYGIPELQGKMEYFDETMRGFVDQALNSELIAMQDTARYLAPKRTGYLARTIFVERVREWAFKFGARAPYAAFVEFGTRFMQPRRFLSRALQTGMPELVRQVNLAIEQAIMEASTR
jgi:HK97 gp10 family phage protein